YEMADKPDVDERLRPTAGAVVVSSGYFETLHARVIAGRMFDASDRASALPVAIVNQRFANRNWPAETAVGKRVRLFTGNVSTPWGKEVTPWLTVVGVVS